MSLVNRVDSIASSLLLIRSPHSSTSSQAASTSSVNPADSNPLPIRSQSVMNSSHDSSSVLSKSESDSRRQNTWRSFSLLLHESERLKTFEGWPVPFISPKDLSRTGFFFLRTHDKVQCVFCNGILGDWQHGDLPVIEHRRHFPNCPFLKDYDVGNVPIRRTELSAEPPAADVTGTGCRWQYRDLIFNVPEKGRNPMSTVQIMCSGTLGITRHTGPQHPNYATIEARLRTFVTWPGSIPQDPQVLAAAGFYYAGISDHVRCFYCDGGLRNWLQNDNPWLEHARWFGNCSFLLLIKGHGFVNEAKISRPPILSEAESWGSSQITAVQKTSSVGAHQLSIDEFMHSSAALAVLDAGIHTDLVREAFKRRQQQTGTTFLDYNALYDACIAIETHVEQRNEPSLTSTAAVPTSTTINDTSSTTPAASLNSTLDLERKTRELALEDTNSLKDVRLCKICMDEELQVLLLPCGHLIACVKCALCLNDCPNCRKSIRGTVRTYFS